MEVDRSKKNETTFYCNYAHHTKVKNILQKADNVKWQMRHCGFVGVVCNAKRYAGLFVGGMLFLIFYLLQSQFVLKFDIYGNEQLKQSEIASFVDKNFSRNKGKIDLEQIQLSLLQEFELISFCSCTIRGQTLLINIKEKVIPQEMIGNFCPIVAKYDGRISQIQLVSGTAVVKVGDIVKRGDVLVEPYTIDSAGQRMQVEASARIEADVYWQSSVDHYDKQIEVVRTGRYFDCNEVLLFGLKIYSHQAETNFDMYETEISVQKISKNMLLPFVQKRTRFYELETMVIETNFADVREQYIEKAKTKVLEICPSCDTIKEEFYTLRHLSGVTIVSYCIITQEEIGEKNVG